MFGLIRKKNPYEQDVLHVYEVVMAHIREPWFYTDVSVPDTFDGRFDMLAAHAFMVIDALNAADLERAADFNQAFFDRIFVQMKVTLREIGVGDVGIPKHMQKMMKAFNGRLHNYTEALDGGDLTAALIRNLYGTVDEPDLADVQKFAEYMEKNVKRLRKLSFEEIIHLEQLFELES